MYRNYLVEFTPRKISWFQVICFEMNLVKIFITDSEADKIEIQNTEML